MESLFLLIPIGIVFVVIAVKILFWAINSGQYDNLDTEAHRILFDEQEHLKRPEETPAPDSQEWEVSARTDRSESPATPQKPDPQEPSR